MLSVFLVVCMLFSTSGIGSLQVKAATGNSLPNGVVSDADTGNGEILPIDLSENMAADVATDLATLSAGAELTTGVYYLSESKTFGSASTMNNGLKIASNATVYIYVPNGITLTAIGGGTNAARKTGGYAGILLPSTSTLIILGGGEVKATGGRAGNGANGSGGTGGTLSVGNYYYGGSGGAGGAGGGGAGAGIGTNGGVGGNGGTATGNGPKETSGKEHYDDVVVNGDSGKTGNSASACGTLYVQNTIMLTATGGSAGSRGSGGTAGSCAYKNKEWDEKDYHVAGGGGGGGGGGAGYSANGIGTGGAAGGGGGSGGRGGIDFSNQNYGNPDINATCNGGGGYGGYGATSGEDGSGTRDSSTYKDKWDQKGGTGGSRGSAGATGSIAKAALTSGWTNKVYTVTFKGVNDETVSQQEYIYGTEGSVLVPEYTLSAAGECFLGWEVSVYGAATKAGADLTSSSSYTDTTVYQPGQSITIEAGVSGSIELKPIIGTLSGASAQTEVLTIPAAEINQEVTYYTYTVETTLDGVATDMGNLTLVDGEGETYTISYEDGVYTYITSKNETYRIFQNGKNLGATVSSEETTVIPYKTLTITTTLNGLPSAAPGDVAISGIDAPSITTDRNSGIYTAVDLASNTNEYHILVDGTDTGETISLGESKTLAYYSTTVNIGGNTAAESVALRNNNGESTYLLTESAPNQYVLIKPAIEGTYTLYVNGFKTDYTTIELSQENNLDVNVFTTVIKTTLNGELADIDSVMIGEQQAIYESIGRYTVMSIMTGDAPTETITISDRNVGSVTIGTEKEVSYYSVEYTHGSTEANILPVDHNVYLASDEVTILSSVTPKNNAYTFDGWNVSGTVKQPGETFTMPPEKVEISANWSETVYNISYELQEPTASNDADNPETYSVSDSFTLEEPTLEGYIFEGWTYGDVIVPTKEVTIPQGTTGELTFVANWILKTYEISVDRADVDFGSRMSGYSGASMVERIGITSIGNQEITVNAPVCDSPDFILNAPETDTVLAGDGGYLEFTIQPVEGLADGTYSGTITVSTAEGNTLTIPVSFAVGQDETPPEASIVVGENSWDDIIFEPENIYYYNSSQDITIQATDTETGVAEIEYFIVTQPLVWSDDNVDWLGTDGTRLTDWEVYDSTNKPVISDEGIYYIYAKVTDHASDPNITDISTDTILIDKTAPTAEFVNDTEVLTNDGIFIGKKQVKVADERLESVSLNGTTYEVLEDGTCTFTVNPNEGVTQEIVARDKAGNVTTISFIVNPREYTITYDLNGGAGTINLEIAKEQIAFTVADGSGIIPPRGMRFAHWAVGSVDATTTIEAGGSFVFEDHTTLYAIWEYVPYDITYNLNGGTNADTNPVTYTMVTEDIVLAEPSREGYIFTGWTWAAAEGVGDAEQSTPVKEVTIPTDSIGNKVFTANWIAKDYTITSDVEAEGIVFDSKLEYVYTTDSIEVSITNAGNWTVNLETPTSDEDNSAFTIGAYSNMSLEPGEASSFTISTKEKLDVGTYTEIITVETLEGTSVDISVSFTVTGDYNAPTGSISIKENQWTEFLNTITFGVFFKETQDVTIVGEDLVNGADDNTGINKIYYYLSETEMSKSDLENLPSEEWEEYVEKFAINPDLKLVVYAKIIDHAENESYISSDGLIFDATAPAILGVEDGKIYCESQTFTVRDDYLKDITVNGTEVTLTDDSYELVGDGTEYTVIATDEAGNVTTVKVTVYATHDVGEPTCVEKAKCQREGCDYEEGTPLGHDWTGDWTVVKEATETEEGRKETLCTRQCGHKKAVMIPATGDVEDVGNLEKSMEIEKEAPIEEATLDNNKSELLAAENIFTDVEIGKIDNGEDARVWIEVSKTNEEQISTANKEKVEQKATEIMGEDFSITYFDADLFKQVGDGEKTPISEPGVAIKITILIPDELLTEDESIIREYKIVRIHGNDVDVMSGEFNAETGEFSFESDKFSTYAIIYSDVSVDDDIIPDDDNNDDTDDDSNDDANDNDTNDDVDDDDNTNDDDADDDNTNDDDADDDNNDDADDGNNDDVVGDGGSNDDEAGDNDSNDDVADDDDNNDVADDDDNKDDVTEDDDSKDDAVEDDNDSMVEDDESDTNDDDEKDTLKSEVIKDIPKAEAEKLSNALKAIQKLVPEVKEGPFVYISSDLTLTDDITDEEAERQMILELPEYLDVEGRVFYLVTVDAEGNIVVIQTEVTEDGMLIFAGNPNATYQLVYEDGTAHLVNLISEGGYLVNANGDIISISNIHCFWHYIILVLACIGIALMFFFKDKRKHQWMVLGIDAVLMILLTNTGYCKWDVWFTLFGIVFMLLVILWMKKKDSKELVQGQ